MLETPSAQRMMACLLARLMTGQMMVNRTHLKPLRVPSPLTRLLQVI